MCLKSNHMTYLNYDGFSQHEKKKTKGEKTINTMHSNLIGQQHSTRQDDRPL